MQEKPPVQAPEQAVELKPKKKSSILLILILIIIAIVALYIMRYYR